jgi:hypothetical protein
MCMTPSPDKKRDTLGHCFPVWGRGGGQTLARSGPWVRDDIVSRDQITVQNRSHVIWGLVGLF